MTGSLEAMRAALADRLALFRQYEEGLAAHEAAIERGDPGELEERLRGANAMLREALLSPGLVSGLHQALGTAPPGPTREALERLREALLETISRAEARVTALRAAAEARRDRVVREIAAQPAEEASASPYARTGAALVDRTG